MTEITDDEINKILTGDWTAGQVATFEALHDPELTGEEILIARLEAELEKLATYVKAANEEITRQDTAIRELEGSLCEARGELSRKQSELVKAKRFLRMIYLEANDDGGRVYLSGKQMSQISEMIKEATQ